MHRREIAILLGTILLCRTTSVFAASLKIDFTPAGGSVEVGWQGYFAVHESAVTFTAQSYSAFGTTVTVTPVWTNNPAQEAKQMIRRSSGSDLVADWIGTDGRVANADPLVLLISGLPAGVYFWTSYHHDPQDQTGLFDVTIADGQGIATTSGIDISNGSLSLDAVTTFRATIVSDGVLPIALSFRVQPFVDVSQAFFVMNAFTLENLQTPEEPPIGEGLDISSVVINEFVASNSRGLLDGDGNASDWIELYNGSSHAVSLAGWRLTDDPADLAKWSFPTGTQLVANGYLVVFASGQIGRAHV